MMQCSILPRNCVCLSFLLQAPHFPLFAIGTEPPWLQVRPVTLPSWLIFFSSSFESCMCVGYFLFTGFDVVASFEFYTLCTKISVLKAVLISTRKWHAHYFEPLCASICSASLQECEVGGRILFGDTFWWCCIQMAG